MAAGHADRHALHQDGGNRLAACGLDEIASAARVLTQVRRWATAAHELAALRSSGSVLTDGGRAHRRPGVRVSYGRKASSNAAATSTARLILPQPPAPVRVSRPASASIRRRRTAAALFVTTDKQGPVRRQIRALYG